MRSERCRLGGEMVICSGGRPEIRQSAMVKGNELRLLEENDAKPCSRIFAAKSLPRSAVPEQP